MWANLATLPSEISQLSWWTLPSSRELKNWFIANLRLLMVTQFGATLLIENRFWRLVRWALQGMHSSCLSVMSNKAPPPPSPQRYGHFPAWVSSKGPGACFAAVLTVPKTDHRACWFAVRGSSRSSTFTTVKRLTNRFHDPSTLRNP